MTREDAPKSISPVWLLAALVVVLITVRVSVEALDSRYATSFRPDAPWLLVTWLALTVLAARAATRWGMRHFSKVSSLACGLCAGLLTGLGRSLMGSSSNTLGESAAVGLAVAVLTVTGAAVWLFPIVTLALHSLAIGLIGYWGIALARRYAIDFGEVFGVTLAFGCLAAQTLVMAHCWYRLTARKGDEPPRGRPFRWVAVPLWLALLLGGWLFGWQTEQDRRMRHFEANGSSIMEVQDSVGVARRRVILSPAATAEDVRTLVLIPRLDALHVRGPVPPELRDVLATRPGLTGMSCERELPPDFFDDVPVPQTLTCPLTSVRMSRALSKGPIRRIDSADCRLSREGLAALASAPNLQVLTLKNPQLNDEDLRAFAGSNLLALHILGRTQVRGGGLRHLCSMPNLSSLTVGDPIDVEGVRAVAEMPALGSAYIWVEELTEEMVEALEKSKNKSFGRVILSVGRIDTDRLATVRNRIPHVKLQVVGGREPINRQFW